MITNALSHAWNTVLPRMGEGREESLVNDRRKSFALQNEGWNGGQSQARGYK